VALLEMAIAYLGTIFPDQAVIATAGGEDVLDLLVVQAGKEEATREEGLVDAAQGAHIDLARYSQTLGILIDLSQMGQCRGCLLVVVAAIPDVLELRKGLAWCIYSASVRMPGKGSEG
jgi:hypothetical protein